MNEDDRQSIVAYRISKARRTYKEVVLHVENELWNTAVNRLYYGCYYAVTSLLISRQIRATTHAGVRQMFGLHFIKTGVVNKQLGRFYSDIFDMRQTGDYEDHFDFTREDVLDLLEPAGQLIAEIERLLKVEQ